jgi:hypothetical protein
MISNLAVRIARPFFCLSFLAFVVVAAAGAQPATALSGVYNGTSTCAQGSTTVKLSLTLSRGSELSGLFTLYLPAGTQKQGHTYSLRGQYNAQTANVSLLPVRWETEPPANVAMMGMNGTFTSNEISGTLTGAGCKAFNVERDQAESANMAAVMAAQKTMTRAAAPAPSQPPAQDAYAAALRAQAPAGVQLPASVGAPSPSKPAPTAAPPPAAAAAPKPPAEKPPAVAPSTNASTTPGIMNEPEGYWKSYRTDLIRQVFDGGFGSDVDEDPRFKLLFNTYVEAFSSNCSAYVPAKHETVVVSEVTTRTDRYGTTTQSVTPKGTVEVDSRFAAKYRQYANQLSSGANGFRVAVGVSSGRTTVNDVMAPANDVQQFFKAEQCQSAAVLQMGENLLRGAAGQRSLQQARAAATGTTSAAFTHFGDACNAFYRDPANARYAKTDATSYCKCLADKYRFAMSPEEERYFAADFQGRFRNNILQPKNAESHPSWNRLHPLAVACVQ